MNAQQAMLVQANISKVHQCRLRGKAGSSDVVATFDTTLRFHVDVALVGRRVLEYCARTFPAHDELPVFATTAGK